jgi:hypothetical protein
VDAPFEPPEGSDRVVVPEERSYGSRPGRTRRQKERKARESEVPPPAARCPCASACVPTRPGVVLGCLLVAALLLYWVPAAGSASPTWTGWAGSA